MQEISEVLGNGFFPIAMCAVMAWYIYQKDQQHQSEMSAIRATIDSMEKSFTGALASLRASLDKLTQTLSGGDPQR